MGKQKIKLEIARVEPSKTSPHGYVLILSEVSVKKNKKRILRIIIGAYEAQAIVIVLEKLRTSRPLTHELFKSFADSLNVKISEVLIHNFNEGVFYANIVFTDGGKSFELDSRTSDAIALALRSNAPIYTYEDILNVAGEPEDVLMFDLNTIIQKVEEIKSQSENKEYDNLSIVELQGMLDEAVENEDYELASKLRDEIKKHKNK